MVKIKYNCLNVYAPPISQKNLCAIPLTSNEQSLKCEFPLCGTNKLLSHFISSYII